MKRTLLFEGNSVFFSTLDSSKELEELRSAFARAVEYLKQEVEESELNHPLHSFLHNEGFKRPILHTVFNLSSSVCSSIWRELQM